MSLIYKISNKKDWEKTNKDSVFNGSEVDQRDGFIHFSTKEQLQETLEKHFQGQTDLLLIAVASEQLGQNLKWETAREGALFPHLYTPLPKKHIVWEKPIEDMDDGTHRLPNDI